jgi:hypothetical protein
VTLRFAIKAACATTFGLFILGLTWSLVLVYAGDRERALNAYETALTMGFLSGAAAISGGLSREEGVE